MSAPRPALAAANLAAAQTVLALHPGCSSKAAAPQPTRLVPEDPGAPLGRAEARLVWMLIAVGTLANGWLVVGLAEAATRFVWFL